MYTPLNLKRFSLARINSKTKIVSICVCMIVIATSAVAHAFLSVNSKYIQFSTSPDRSGAQSLANKTVNENVYIFLTYKDPNIKSVSYFLNPSGSLNSKYAYSTRTVAPFDLAGADANGRAKGFDTRSLKSGNNALVTKITLKNGYVHHDYTWFKVGSNSQVPTTTTTKPTTTTSSTTTSSTTTTTVNHGDHNGSMNENCTPGTQGMHGPCIDRSAIPAPRAGFSTTRIDQVSPPSGTGGEPGAFRTRCDFSHMNNDDPVLYWNQPNKAHLHSYFGNTGANAFSTSNSLMNSGNSTCSGGILNRSSYWTPSMVDSRNGRPITPNDDRGRYNSDLEIYYKLGYQGVGYRDVRPFPNGLQIIAGNSASATSPTTDSKVKYWCEGSVDVDRTRNLEGYAIPICTQGQVLVMNIDFPQCWDGVNLRSANGRSHMAYGQWRPGNVETSIGCPSSHPVGLPSIAMFVRYRVQSGDTSSWKLASDNYSAGPGGYSGHADYVFAWPENSFQNVINNCYRRLIDCGYQLGDGREPRSPRL